jgi:ABC-type Fe3+/spermidine/putrescine transport system ATPase subunit
MAFDRNLRCLQNLQGRETQGTDVTALDNINIKVEKKEFLCLLGPSPDAASPRCSI